MLGGETPATGEAQGPACFRLIGASWAWLAGFEPISRMLAGWALTCNEARPNSDGVVLSTPWGYPVLGNGGIQTGHQLGDWPGAWPCPLGSPTPWASQCPPCPLCVVCSPGTCTRGDVGGSKRPVGITPRAKVAGELPFPLLEGARWAWHTLLRLAVVIRSLRAAD